MTTALDEIRSVDYRHFASPEHEKRAIKAPFPHVAPYSTLIAAIGNHWEPGCWESIKAMADYTANICEYPLLLYEERDRCYNWGDALGSMRNMAINKAIYGGWQYLMMMDNDIQVGKDCLVRLLHRHLPIIAPIVAYTDGETHGLETPKLERGKGVAMVGSVVLSCLLVRTSLFLPWALTGFFSNAIGDDEEYHFTRLFMAGHMPWIDTDVEVVAVKPPHFPLDTKRRAQ